MDTLSKNINKLPRDLIHLIQEFVQKRELVFVNKTNYTLYHTLIKPHIRNYDKYTRDVIKRDNAFVFERIVEENYARWFRIKQFIYKNFI